jgi:hypothetical protein
MKGQVSIPGHEMSRDVIKCNPLSGMPKILSLKSYLSERYTAVESRFNEGVYNQRHAL